MTTTLRVKDVARRYELGKDNFVDALRGVTLDIGAGEMVAIMGPSGSGKSTLMHVAGGLDTPDRGEVWIGEERVDTLSDKDLAAIRRTHIGFVFQGFNLLPTLSAVENVALAGEYAGTGRRTATQRAEAVLTELGLAERLRHRPSELSGGEQQRVAVARALVNQPSVLMADEPTGNLDSENSAEIMELLTRVNRDHGTTVVLVTHDPGVAAACGRLVHIHDGLVSGEEVRS
ncbi:MAG: ABC transporter ATP-binding protein [Actinomycetota bacterium]